MTHRTYHDDRKQSGDDFQARRQRSSSLNNTPYLNHSSSLPSMSSTPPTKSFAWPALSSFGLPTAYTHDRRLPASLNEPQHAYLPASMNPDRGASPTYFSTSPDDVPRGGSTFEPWTQIHQHASPSAAEYRPPLGGGNKSSSGVTAPAPTPSAAYISDDDQRADTSHHGVAHLSSSSAGYTNSSYGWTSSNFRTSQRSQKSSQTSLHSSPQLEPGRKLSLDSVVGGVNTRLSSSASASAAASRPPTVRTRSNTSRGTHSESQTTHSSRVASRPTSGSAKSNSQHAGQSETSLTEPAQEQGHQRDVDTEEAPTETDATAEAYTQYAPPLQDVAERSEVSTPAERHSVAVSRRLGSHSSDAAISMRPPADEQQQDQQHQPDVHEDAREQYAHLEALHMAELQEQGYYVYDDSVYVTRNGCEAVFLPRPRLDISAHISQNHNHVSGALNTCWTTESLDDVWQHDAVRRATFERNRRPSRKSLGAIEASKSTPNLASASGAGDAERACKAASRPSLRIADDEDAQRGRSNSQPAPRPAAPRTEGTPALDTDHGTASPHSSIRGDSPEMQRVMPHARPKGMDKAFFDGADADDGDEEDYDREALLRRRADFEAERSAWRAEFARSIEGRGRRGTAGPGDKPRRSKSKKRRPATASGAGVNDENDEEHKVRTRMELLSAGPQAKRRGAASKRLEHEAKERHASDGKMGGSHSRPSTASASGAGSVRPPLPQRLLSTTRDDGQHGFVHNATQAAESNAVDTSLLCVPVPVAGRKSTSKDSSIGRGRPTSLVKLWRKHTSLSPGPVVLPPTSSDRENYSTQSDSNEVSVESAHARVVASGLPLTSYDTGRMEAQPTSSGQQTHESGMLHPSMLLSSEDMKHLRRRSGGTTGSRSSPPRVPAPKRPLPAIPPSHSQSYDASSIREDLLPEDEVQGNNNHHHRQSGLPFEGTIAGLGLYSESVGDLHSGGSAKADSIIEPRVAGAGAATGSSCGHAVGGSIGAMTPKSSVHRIPSDVE